MGKLQLARTIFAVSSVRRKSCKVVSLTNDPLRSIIPVSARHDAIADDASSEPRSELNEEAQTVYDKIHVSTIKKFTPKCVTPVLNLSFHSQNKQIFSTLADPRTVYDLAAFGILLV